MRHLSKILKSKTPTGIIGSESASIYIFLVPLVSLTASVIVYDESASMGLLFGGMFAMFAVYLLGSSKKQTFKNDSTLP